MLDHFGKKIWTEIDEPFWRKSWSKLIIFETLSILRAL
jgi:hypothetical protein